jgi:ligand-binding sensor domain-containing protein/two-component sensor histidine kinase
MIKTANIIPVFIISILCRFFSPSMLYGVGEEFFLKQFKSEEGLSQSTVLCMLQDRKGYLWFGTGNGLNRYDGYNFMIFSNDPADTTSISNNGILSICEDTNGIIWIGTIEGVLNRFDRRKGTFSRYYITENLKTDIDPEEIFSEFPLPFSRNNDKSITSIVQDKSGFLWIGTWGKGLLKFDPSSARCEHFHFEKNHSEGFQSNRIRAILANDDGSLWIGTLGGGLYKIIPGRNAQIIRYRHNKNRWSLGDNKIFSLFKDTRGDLWIGTYGSGLFRFSREEQNRDPESARFDGSINKLNGSSGLSGDIVTCFMLDRTGILWIGTFRRGVKRFNDRKGSFLEFNRGSSVSELLSANDILSLSEDRSGTIWVGTHLSDGLINLERSAVKFKKIKKAPAGSAGLDDDVVWSLCEEDKTGVPNSSSNIWIGTFKGGLNLFDRGSGKFYYYKTDRTNPNSVSDNHIRAILDDHNGNLWIGTYSGGLDIFNKKTRRFKCYRNNPDDSTSLGSNQVQSILIDRDKNFWIGTFGGGLNKLSAGDLKAGRIRFKRYLQNPGDPFSISDNRIYSLLEDKSGIIWIGTFGGGLVKFDPEKEQFISYKNIHGDESSLSDNRVVASYEDESGYLWVGTYGGGLQKFDKQKEKFIHFGKRNKLNSSVVYGILPDQNNNLWMSTDNGLFKLNMLTEDFTQYDLHDGLQNMEFSGGAYLKCRSGEMFFGGINGLNYFYPDSIKDNKNIPSIVVTSTRVFHEPVRGERDSLELSYSQSFFTFEFSALDFTNPKDNQYAYMMEGFDDNWHYVESRRRNASYTNLPPGRYIFRVRGSNNDGYWNDRGASINIRILPPLWEKWWFITCAISLIIFLVVYLSTIRYRNLLAIEKIKSRLAADLHDNVGAGLTEISILSELAMQGKINQASPDQNIVSISERARQLIDAMSDIVWMVNPKRDTLYHLILRLKDTYSDLFHSAGISFSTINIERLDPFRLSMEYKNNLFLIFKEAINNSLKHSGCQKITLEVNVGKDTFELSLVDDGSGFDPESVTNGNGLINMKSRARSIGGDLKIEATSRGTSVKFTGKIAGIRKLFYRLSDWPPKKRTV